MTLELPHTPQWRPAWHFSPPAMWANDPNGLLHHQGVWHLYYQHHPHSLQWGPMHWGHASSGDLLHWQHHPVALAPDALGMVFSGSAVLDSHNSSGLGANGSAPWVAMYTQHGEHAEHQGLAASQDHGLTWTPYAGNPVLPNPGLKDFRDPKLAPCPEAGGWRMVLAAQDHVRLYTSPNLRQWQEASRFGPLQGLGSGVWECPDLFALPTPEGDAQRWVLVVSFTTGGPNGGSATGYWLGQMQGQRFVPDSPALRWLDHGPDHYAGVTWHGTGTRRLMLAWMSNWAYAREVPTAPWRGAMTQPRELALARVGDSLHLVQQPAAELLAGPWLAVGPDALDGAPFWLQAQPEAGHGDWSISLANDAGERLVAGYERAANAFYVDRRQAGRSDFAPGFAQRAWAPRVAAGVPGPLQLWVDRSSVELLADGGLCTLTALCFPSRPWRRVQVQGSLANLQFMRYEGEA